MRNSSILLALLALAMLSGCASSRRMMRVSPFSEPVDQSMQADRLNLFPLAYKQADQTSLLWPFIDIDDQGFAVRPLLNVEKDDISVLFPLSSVNTQRKVGWLLNGYKYEDYAGFFPLVHWGKEFRWIAPYWTTPKQKEWGVFPLYGNLGRGTHHITLAWWDTDKEDGLESLGVFPLFRHSPRDNESWLWPLYSADWSEEGEWHDGWAALGLASWSSDDEGNRSRILHPLYYNIKEGTDRTLAVVPFYASFTSTNGTLRLTPLGGYGTTADGQKIRSVLGPLYVDSKGSNGSAAWLAGIGHWQHAGPEQESAWRLWPLASQWNGPDAPDWFYYLTLAGWNQGDDFLHWHATPLIRYHRDASQTGFRAWPLAAMWTGGHPPSPIDFVTLFSLGRSEHGYRASLTPLIGASKRNKTKSWWAWPIVTHKHSDTYSKTHLGGGLLYSYKKYQANTAKESITHHVPLIFKSRRSADHHKLRFLFGAVSYDREKTHRARISVLKYLYRREREGDDVRRDVFPFIKWDTHPDGGRFSFLGRVWNIERDAEGKRSGHVLFIPWGK